MVVYCVTNKINGKKYIGSDSNNNPKYYGSGVNIKKAIKKYSKENFTKQIINEVSNAELMKELEEYWINYFDAYNNPMFYNATKFSAGITKFPKDKIDNIRKANIGNKYHKGYKQSEYQKSQTSKANKGRKMSDKEKQTRKNKALGNKYALGNKLSKEAKYKISKNKSKRIFQYDLQNNLIKEWESIKIASKILNIDGGQISRCCNDKIVKVKNFIFKFK